MNEDHHPVGRPSERGPAKIDPAELRERIGGTKIAVVFTKREATALLGRIEELEAALGRIATGELVTDNWVAEFARKALSGEKP